MARNSFLRTRLGDDLEKNWEKQIWIEHDWYYWYWKKWYWYIHFQLRLEDIFWFLISIVMEWWENRDVRVICTGHEWYDWYLWDIWLLFGEVNVGLGNFLVGLWNFPPKESTPWPGPRVARIENSHVARVPWGPHRGLRPQMPQPSWVNMSYHFVGNFKTVNRIDNHR